MDKLSQHLNLRDSDQHNLWHTIDAGIEVHADCHDDNDDFLDLQKHMCFYNADFLEEGMQSDA